MADYEELVTFIDELRRRHAAGEFRGQSGWRIVPSIELGDVDFAIGRMLEDVDYYRDMQPANRRHFEGPRRQLHDCLLGVQAYLCGRRLTDADLERARQRTPGWM